jgi:hypothetical protein
MVGHRLGDGLWEHFRGDGFLGEHLRDDGFLGECFLGEHLRSRLIFSIHGFPHGFLRQSSFNTIL